MAEEQVTWDEAESACTMDNASLVSIHTTPENAAMLLAHEQNNRTSFWIGLHDPGVSGNNFAKLSMLNWICTLKWPRHFGNHLQISPLFYWFKNLYELLHKTRMYSSRMRTICCNGRLGVGIFTWSGGVCVGGCLPGGGRVCLGGVFTWGVSPWGCLPRGVVCPGGFLLRGVSARGGACLPRGCLHGRCTPPPWTEWQMLVNT